MSRESIIRDAANNDRGANVTAANRLQVETQGAASGGTSSTDDAAFTAGTDSGTPFMGFVTTDEIDSGDVGVLAMSVRRELHIAYGKTVKTLVGTASSSGNNTLVSAVASNKIKVLHMTLTTISTTAVTCTLQDGAGGTPLWHCILQAISGANTGVEVPMSLIPFCETSVNILLNLNLNSAQNILWAISYIEEA